MRVTLASYQAVTILHGGPNTQLRQTARHLPEWGAEPMLFDPWKPFSPSDADLVHLFAANIGTYHLGREIHALGMPLAVSPIIFSSHSNRFVRSGLRISRGMQTVWRGVWSDYALASDLCQWSDVVLPNTQAEARLVIEGLDAESKKVTVVPNGVEERFADADSTLFRKRFGLEGFILNVGHIGHERKNVLSLIRALGEIDHPSVLIGRMIRGRYGDACRLEAAKHSQILLLDGLDHDSELLASAYAACSVFALPSLFETPGIAALEAALAGARIVVTPMGGTREYFGSMATYVDPGSVSSIRDGITQALNQPDDPRLREHVRREFTWRQVARKTADAYKTALATRRTPG